MLTRNIAQSALIVILLAIAAIGAYFGGGPRHAPLAHAPKAEIKSEAVAAAPKAEIKAEEKKQESAAELFTIPAQRRKHILYGDETGGGHKAGVGFPGKTEFPASWDDEKIIAASLDAANDPDVPMRESGRYWLKMKEIDGVQVRVVLDRKLGEVVTSYPLNLPRNPGGRSRRGD